MSTVTHRRVFAAPRELVYRCMVSPEHLTQFWGPAGMSAPLDGITVDLRPGGVFETVMVADRGPGTYTMHAVFDEIVAPERLAWTETTSGMRTLATFTDLGDGRTEVVIEQSNVPAAMLTPENQRGFLSSLDKLEDHLARLAGGDPS